MLSLEIPGAIRHGSCSPGSKRILEKKKKTWPYSSKTLRSQTKYFENSENGIPLTTFMIWKRKKYKKKTIIFTCYNIKIGWKWLLLFVKQWASSNTQSKFINRCMLFGEQVHVIRASSKENLAYSLVIYWIFTTYEALR